MTVSIVVDPHPLLDLGAFETAFPAPLGEVPSPPELLALLDLTVSAPLQRDEALRGQVRDLLRHGGYKPTGRGKPASEYLVRAVGAGKLGPINQAVDACNVVSLHSGLPISVVDMELAQSPLRVGLAEPGAEYVFNTAGQTIKVGGLLCLHDAGGPTANAVKDGQRTKTRPETTRVLSLVWGTNAAPGRTAATVAWYRELLTGLGAETQEVPLQRA